MAIAVKTFITNSVARLKYLAQLAEEAVVNDSALAQKIYGAAHSIVTELKPLLSEVEALYPEITPLIELVEKALGVQ